MSSPFCRRREEQSAKLRKTAEKLLLNQLKKHALKNMSGPQQAAVLQQAKQTSTADPTKSEEIPADLLVSAPELLTNIHSNYGWTCPVPAIKHRLSESAVSGSCRQ